MKKILVALLLILTLGFYSCETASDISNHLDHQVPDCKMLTLSDNGQTVIISDSISSLLLWGVVPTTNLQEIYLPTLSVNKGSTLHISVIISDNVGLKNVSMDYSNWLFSKYINFENPEGDIPLTPKSYTMTADVVVPDNAVSTPWLEDYYFNDGSSMKITQSYHKITLTVYDINMNQRIIPIFVKVK